MIYSLSNEKLSLSIKNTGMELCSVTSKRSDVEYIWQATPDIWGSHAPVLFPIIGALKNGQFTFDGVSYSLPKHGIVRYNEDVELLQQTTDSLKFSLPWSNETLRHYPFKFEFQTCYRLSGQTLNVEHKVLNRGDGTMYFSLGGHPAFNCPLFDGEAYTDYCLEFEHDETAPFYMLAPNGLVSNKTIQVLDGSKKLWLHDHLFDNDALIFKDLRSRSVSLKSKKAGSILTVDYAGFPYLGIWAKPGAPFVCIEPWQGIADPWDTTQDITEKEGILSLGAGERHQATYSITFHK